MAHIRALRTHDQKPSSQIYSMDYDPVDERLEVKFTCGSCRGQENPTCTKCKGAGHSSTYSYDKVPADKYALVRDHPESIGKAFGEHIKKGGYKFTRL